MSKVKVLFFAADPLSVPPDGGTPRLLLDEDLRQIREKVRAAKHRNALEFDVRWAARTDDLLQALNETRPHVVHFSGHGENGALVMVSSDGAGPHYVDAAALARLFALFKGDIRVVVLNACFSLPQAQAIAGAVGCAIGTTGEVSDRAAIAFGASFYRALAFGRSVQAAYDQARAALALEHFEDRECPQLVTRPGVDPARLVLVTRRSLGRVAAGIAGLALASATVVAGVMRADRNSSSRDPGHADSVQTDGRQLPNTAVQTAQTAPAAKAVPDESHSHAKQPVLRSQPVNQGEQSSEPPRQPERTTTFEKLPASPDTVPFLRDTPRDPTLRPAYPR